MASDDPVPSWMAWEVRNLNRGVVVRRRSLAALLAEDRPTATTREGEPYPFDPVVLEVLAAATDPDQRAKLKLPIAVEFRADLSGEAVVRDAVASDVLRRLEGFGEAYPYRDGRMLLPHSLALTLIIKYRGALQQLFL